MDSPASNNEETEDMRQGAQRWDNRQHRQKEPEGETHGRRAGCADDSREGFRPRRPEGDPGRVGSLEVRKQLRLKEAMAAVAGWKTRKERAKTCTGDQWGCMTFSQDTSQPV